MDNIKYEIIDKEPEMDNPKPTISTNINNSNTFEQNVFNYIEKTIQNYIF